MITYYRLAFIVTLANIGVGQAGEQLGALILDGAPGKAGARCRVDFSILDLGRRGKLLRGGHDGLTVVPPTRDGGVE